MCGSALWRETSTMSKIIALAPTRPARMSSKLKEAIRLRVEDGVTINIACAKAGISPQGWFKAMKRPHVRDFLADMQAKFVASADAKRSHLKAQAIEVARDLLMNSKSEAIRARMVEFILADAKVSPVAVHIDARQDRGGYEYARPGAQVVEIIEPPEAAGQPDPAQS